MAGPLATSLARQHKKYKATNTNPQKNSISPIFFVKNCQKQNNKRHPTIITAHRITVTSQSTRGRASSSTKATRKDGFKSVHSNANRAEHQHAQHHQDREAAQ
jgi:hypothetical protein